MTERMPQHLLWMRLGEVSATMGPVSGTAQKGFQPCVSQMVTLRVGGTLGAWMHESNKNEVSKAPQIPAWPGAQINGLQRENTTRMCECWQLQKHKRV